MDIYEQRGKEAYYYILPEVIFNYSLIKLISDSLSYAVFHVNKGKRAVSIKYSLLRIWNNIVFLLRAIVMITIIWCGLADKSPILRVVRNLMILN